MITPNELLHEFETVTDAYLAIANAFTEEAYNTIPFAGSWTPAQVTDHLFKSDCSLVNVLNGPARVSIREADEQVGNLRAVFLDFSTKLKSPDFIIPDNITHNQQEQLAAFKEVRTQIGKTITSLDLTETCHMPIFGEPTRYELIHFIIYHTMRHTNQVKKMLEKGRQPAQ